MIFILTGPVNSGKTTFLKRAIEEFKRQRLSLDGFLSEAVMKNQEKIGYDLLDLKMKISVPFIRKSGQKDWQRIGCYFFIPRALDLAKRIILRSKEAEILIVDEIGPLELAGHGFWPALEKVIFKRARKFLFVLRKSVLEDFLSIVGKRKAKIFDVEDEEIFSPMLEEITKPY